MHRQIKKHESLCYPFAKLHFFCLADDYCIFFDNTVMKHNQDWLTSISTSIVSRRRVAYSIAINTCAAIIFQRTTQPGIDIPGYRAMTPDGVMASSNDSAVVNDGGSAVDSQWVYLGVPPLSRRNGAGRRSARLGSPG